MSVWIFFFNNKNVLKDKRVCVSVGGAAHIVGRNTQTLLRVCNLLFECHSTKVPRCLKVNQTLILIPEHCLFLPF